MLCPGYLFRRFTSQPSPWVWLVFVPELNTPCLDGRVQTGPSVLVGCTPCVIFLGPFAHPALARPETATLRLL